MRRLVGRVAPTLLVLSSLVWLINGKDARPTLEILFRSSSSLSIGWDFDDAGDATIYDLMMDGETVFTGEGFSHTERDLHPESCHEFVVRAFVKDANGDGSRHWSEPSATLRAGTLSEDAPDLETISKELALERASLAEAAVESVNKDPCGLSGLTSPRYVRGGPSHVVFAAESIGVAPEGDQAAKYNCRRARCVPDSAETLPLSAAFSGRLETINTVSGNPHGSSRFVYIPEGKNVLHITDATAGPQGRVLPLPGCRAMQRKALEGSDRSYDRPACFDVHCPASLQAWVFCAPESDSAAEWVGHINEAGLGFNRPGQWEVMARVGPVARPVDNDRRPAAKGVWEEAAYRDAWVASFLAGLVRAGACPHFPDWIRAFRCAKLPEKWVPAVQGQAAGGSLLPRGVPGASAVGLGSEAVAKGADSDDHLWGASLYESWDSNLAAMLDGWSGAVLQENWVRGIMFQVIFAVGVARHAFGFHHNGLRSLSPIQLTFSPLGASDRVPFWCYQVSEGAIAMRPVQLATERPIDDSDWGDLARHRDALPALKLVGQDVCGGAASDSDAKESSSSSSSSSGRGKGAAEASTSRTSWCMQSDDVDGLRVKLTDFGTSALTRVQLAFFAAGYAFPNPEWRDDLADFATSFCGQVSPLVRNPSGAFKSFCRRMSRGAFSGRPLLALQDPWFGEYPPVSAVPAPSRRVTAYAPVTKQKGATAGGGSGEGDISGTAGGGMGGQNASSTGGTGGTRGDAGEQGGEGPGAASSGEGGQPSSPWMDVNEDLRARVIRMLTPGPPWVVMEDGARVDVRWDGRPEEPLGGGQLPRKPRMFALFLNGVSVYSGPATEFMWMRPSDDNIHPAAQALRGDARAPDMTHLFATKCREFRVAAWYDGLGWTPRSPPLRNGKCPAVMHTVDAHLRANTAYGDRTTRLPV